MHNTRRTSSLWLAGLLLFILLWIGPALLHGRVLLPLDLVTQLWPPWQQPTTAVAPHNPLLSDVVDYIYPVKTFVADTLKAGTLPLWNPYVLGGYPLTYNTQAGLWYPLSLFYYLLPAPTAVDLTIFVQLCLGGLFLFAYLRQLRLHPAAALLGAILFLFNGMMVSWLEWQVVHAGVIWLPLCLYAIDRLVPRLQTAHGRLPTRSILLAAVAFALPWLGGHWNWALYSSLIAICYLTWRLAQIVRQQKKPTPRLLATAVAVPLLGAGLSALQIIPAVIYLSQSHRHPFTLAQSLALGLKDRAIVALLPNFFGNPVTHDWWGPTNYNETAVYLGILPLFLAPILLFLRRDSLAYFYTTLTTLGWLATLGTPVYGLLWLLPVFDGLWPSRAMPVALFGTAVLAALTLHHLLHHPVPWSRLARCWLGITAVCLLIITLYTTYYQPDWNQLQPALAWFGLMWLASSTLLLARPWLSPTHFALLAIILVGADLFYIGHRYNTVGHLADLYPETETSQFLQNDPDPYRIATLPQGVAYPPNTALQARIPAISGYEPGILQPWVDYFSAVEGQRAIYFDRELMPWHNLHSPLLDAVNLKYFVTIDDWYAAEPTPGPGLTGQTWQPLTPTAVNQPLTMPIAGLQRIDLFLQTDATAQGTLTLHLFSADGLQPLAHAEWLVQPNYEGAASFYFSPFPSQWGLEFLMQLQFSGTGTLQIHTTAEGIAYQTYFLDRPTLVHEAGKTRIYLNEGYFPRAYMVPQALLATDAADALNQLLANQHRLHELVVLEAAALPAGFGHAQNATAVLTSQTVNQVTLQTESDAPAYLVLADTYYPGWQATINGEVTDVYRANSVVRAVAVPAGSHEVVFRFHPTDFYAGLAITAVSLLVSLMLLFAGGRPTPAYES